MLSKLVIKSGLVPRMSRVFWDKIFAIKQYAFNLFHWVVVTVKILSKHHIVREKKVPYVKREREVLVKIKHPFFVKLYFTFQDKENLCILDNQ